MRIEPVIEIKRIDLNEIDQEISQKIKYEIMNNGDSPEVIINSVKHILDFLNEFKLYETAKMLKIILNNMT